jgi:hypothetical protein
MNFIKFRNASLALTGLIALAAYVLACRSAFSPDGSKILFPAAAAKDQHASVILYDRETKKAETIFSIALGVPAGEFMMSAQWTADGKQAVIAWPEEEAGLRVMLLPVEAKGPAMLFILPEVNEQWQSLVIPPPVVGHHLFIGGKAVHRLDLASGQIATNEHKHELVLTKHSNEIYYMSGEDEVFSIGTLDKEKLVPIPRLQLKKADVGELSPFICLTGDSARIALLGERDEQQTLRIYRGKDLEKTVVLGEIAKIGRLGNTQWSPDGKTVYAACAQKLAEDRLQLGVVEIALNAEGLRQIPLLQIASGKDEEVVFRFQIALSPDGQCVAASPTCLETDKLKPEDRALYLIDLGSPQRKVTKAPIPGPRP